MNKKIKRILLINPFQVSSAGYDINIVRSGGQYAEFPLGLAYLSAAIKQNLGLEVEVFDANLEAVRYINNSKNSSLHHLRMLVEKKLLDFKPDLVGISCLFHSTYKMAHFTCEIVKSISADIITVMGGIYPTVSYNVALLDKNVDLIVFSEGEESLVRLIDYLDNNYDISKIDGIAYKSNGKIYANPKKHYLQALDILPWPDRKSMIIDDYVKYTRHFLTRFADRKEMKILTMTASRGCPFACTFCATRIYWGSRIRHRDPQIVLNEIEFLIKEYGATHIVFNDDNFNVRKDVLSQILRGIINRKLKIRWVSSGGLCIAGLDKGIIREMYDSGIVTFNLAIESGNSAMLKKIKKPVLLDRVRDIIRQIRNYGDAYIIGYFMIGLPFETRKELEETYLFAKEMGFDWVLFSRVQPYPGTEIYDYCVKNNLLSLDYDFENLQLNKANIHNKDFDEEYLDKKAYLSNLDINFVNSRNIKNGNLEQAIRDFKWVIEMVPDHAIGYYSLGNAYLEKNLIEEAKSCFRVARGLINDNKEWKGYFDYFNINLNGKLENIGVNK